MAYEIKRAKHFTDTIVISDNGEELRLPVEIHIDDILTAVNKAFRELAIAQEALVLAQAGDDMEKLGRASEGLQDATRTLFTWLFGEGSAKEIGDFYDGRWMEVLADFYPYLNTVLIPKIKEAQLAIAAAYKIK